MKQVYREGGREREGEREGGEGERERKERERERKREREREAGLRDVSILSCKVHWSFTDLISRINLDTGSQQHPHTLQVPHLHTHRRSFDWITCHVTVT